jgi:hydroxymethylbilane synthase
MCPAAGQGALAVETRAEDAEVIAALAFLEDSTARKETDCERALLKAMGGGCQVPIGANAKLQGNALHLEAVTATPDGKTVLRESAEGHNAVYLGESVAKRLLDRGGSSILESVYAQNPELPQQP